jgi:hypothetical protein
LEKKLAKKMSVIVAGPADKPAAGSLVFTGCFVGAPYRLTAMLMEWPPLSN